MATLGHEVQVFSCVPNYPDGSFFDGYSNQLRRKEKWNGVSVHRVRTIPRGKTKFNLVLNYISYPFAAIYTLFREIKEPPDIIFVSLLSPIFQAFPGIFLRWMKGTPCVYWVQDIWPEAVTYTLDIKNPLLSRPLKWLCGWIYRRADLILVLSPGYTPLIERFGVLSDRILTLPNTAPSNFVPVSPEAAPCEAAIVPQDGFRLMFAGNIGESHDFDTVIATANLLRNCANLNWVIVGSGRDVDRIKRKVEAEKLSERFFFLGRYPEERMPFFFAHADALLISLKGYPIFDVGIPYKFQSYLACGKPIIGSLNGVCASLIEEAKVGYAVRASTPELLAEAITRMMDLDAESRVAFGDNARKYFEQNYSASRIYPHLENCLYEVAGRTVRR